MQNNNKNIILACVLSAMILISWTWLYEKPRMEAQQKIANGVAQNVSSDSGANNNSASVKSEETKNQIASKQAVINFKSKEEILSDTKSQRVQIKTPNLDGSINLKGLVFDDLKLANYKETLDKNSKEVTLLSPTGSTSSYNVNFSYQSFDENIQTPDSNSIWKANGDVLTTEKPITFTWQNNQKITFEITVSIDENYMFFISQKIKNNSGKNFEGTFDADISRFLPQTQSSNFILHEGPIGVFDKILHEKSYDDVKEGGAENSFTAKDGWFGISDKYWLVSIIPDKKSEISTRFSYVNQNYIVNYQSQKFVSQNGEEVSFENKLFAGAKQVSLLDEYSKKYDITRFDLAVDFGWYYFLTKPFFFILQFFSNLLGNYGLAILAITIIVKLAMFPLANKSFTAMARIKKLQPKIDKIRETYKGKVMQMNKEIMELYKREKVSPVSGCLPMLIQIPVFFSLYKVLYVTIDMRHAPFYGWIKDLSAPDPTSILNLFGLLPFDVHGIIMIGIWPILMGVTMIVQQMLNPKPSDPAQAKVLKILPYILIFVFATFPAGLLIYWTWSNLLSIAQQYYITKKVETQK